MGYHIRHTLDIHFITKSASRIIISWNGRPDTCYIVQCSTDLWTWNDIFGGFRDEWSDAGVTEVEKYYTSPEQQETRH